MNSGIEMYLDSFFSYGEIKFLLSEVFKIYRIYFK